MGILPMITGWKPVLPEIAAGGGCATPFVGRPSLP